MAKNKEFKIPNQFFSQLNEFCEGGFVLFSFDSNGNLVVNSSFEGRRDAAAMQYYISKWSQAVDQMNINITANSIIKKNKN